MSLLTSCTHVAKTASDGTSCCEYESECECVRVCVGMCVVGVCECSRVELMVMQNICTQIIFQGLKLAFIRKLFFHMHAFSHAHMHTRTHIHR